MQIPIDKILPNPEQPRKYFDQVELEELAQSIREHGIIEPLVLEESNAGLYIIHDGERRWRAAKLAGLKEIPASVVPPLNGTGPQNRLERALICNIQRSDLNPIEEAQAFSRLREMDLSENKIAISLGISIARVHQRLRLLLLDKPIQNLIAANKISKDIHLVDALLEVPDQKARIALANKFAEHHTTVNASVEACKKVIGHLAAEQIIDGEPSLKIATKHTGAVNQLQWDALAQVGRLPPWLLVELAVRDTCKNCSLAELASEVTCKDCPLVVMLIQMIGKANHGPERNR